MTREVPNPGLSHDFAELVWENGTIFTRGRSDQNNAASPLGYARFPNNNKVGGVEKAPRFRAHDHAFMFFDSDASRPDGDKFRLYETPTSILRPGLDSNRDLFTANGFSQASSRSLGGETNKLNFSHFLGLNSLINEANSGHGSGNSRSRITPRDVEMDELGKAKNRTASDQKQPVRVVPESDTAVLKTDPSSFAAGGGDSLVPDEHSQAVGNKILDDHFIRNSTLDDHDHQVPGQDSSMGASNTPRRKLKRRLFEESESTYLDEDEDEEPDHKTRTAQHHSGGSNTTKRSRSTIHNLSEKKRRDRINKRMRTLQELLPNCNKVDKASVLDEAIEYMKTLQLQLQIMSTGNRLMASHMAMFPIGMHQMPMPFLNQFSPMSAGLGMRMAPGFAQGPVHQFPLAGPGPTGFGGGFQPMGCMPFMPVLGGHPAFRSFMNAADLSRAATGMMDQQVSVPVSGLNDSNQSKDFSEVGHH